jgi:hypothetical protein
MIMRNEEKIRKQKNSLLWLPHKLGLGLLGLTAVIVLIHAFGASFSTAVGMYLGYKVLRLFSLVVASVFTVVSIIILIAIISLLIF